MKKKMAVKRWKLRRGEEGVEERRELHREGKMEVFSFQDGKEMFIKNLIFDISFLHKSSLKMQKFECIMHN